MVIHEFIKPIPVVVEDGKEGYILYVESSGQFDNDIFCIVLKDGGGLVHCLSNQVRVSCNSTFGIKKSAEAL